jgi:ABC-type transport system involved in multi-copper enzyme maturation permease subunit
MSPIWPVAKDTVREMSRKKLLLAIIVAGIFTAILFTISVAVVPVAAERMAAGLAQGRQAPSETMDALTGQFKEKGYNLLVTCFSIAIELIGTFLTILMFSTFLPTEIDRGTVKLIISKPVSRCQLIMGKFLGGLLVLAGYSILMGGLQILGSLYLTGKLEPADRYSIALLFFNLMVRGSITMALSMIMRPVLSGVIAFFFSGDIFIVGTIFSAKFIYYPSVILYYIFPTYSLFETRTIWNFFTSLLSSETITLTLTDICYRTAYALDIIVIMVALTVILFNRKDLIQ